MCGACISTQLSRGSSAYVHVAANGAVTLWGEPVELDNVGKTLKKIGATRETPVKIIPHGDVSDRLLRSVAGSVARQGFARVLIIEPRKQVAIVDGITVTEVVTNEHSEATPPSR